MTTLDPEPQGRGIRASVGAQNRHEDDPTVVVDLGGPTGHVVDRAPLDVRWVRLDRGHAILVWGGDGEDGAAGAGSATRVILGDPRRRETDGMLLREVVVDGWRVEVELEAESRATLRERARRAGAATVAGGPAEVHAIIPGRIVAVSVVPGDPVVAGQQLLVLEAMKMQNELRAPRDGVVERVAVAVGDTVEVGDLLLVIR